MTDEQIAEIYARPGSVFWRPDPFESGVSVPGGAAQRRHRKNRHIWRSGKCSKG